MDRMDRMDRSVRPDEIAGIDDGTTDEWIDLSYIGVG